MAFLKKGRKDKKHQLVKTSTIQPEFERYPTFVELEEHLINTESKLNDPSYDKYDKIILKESLDKIKDEVIGRARVVYDSTNYLPSELGITPLIKYCSKKQKKSVGSFKVDDLTEVVLKVYPNQVHLHKIGTSKTDPFYYPELGWNDLHKSILMDLGVLGWYNEPIEYRKQNINIINTELKDLLGIKESPISYNKSMKRYESDIEIKCYDADMKLMNAQREVDNFDVDKRRKSIGDYEKSKNHYKSVSHMGVYHSDDIE
tara:strand:+ start:4009 stop:4785 length:777 start_codon:yes stop_codon:yes gene_type:complete